MVAPSTLDLAGQRRGHDECSREVVVVEEEEANAGGERVDHHGRLLARGTLSGGGGATRRRREASDAFMDGRPSDDASTIEGEGSPTVGGGA